MQPQSFDYYAPEAVEIVIQKYVRDLDRRRSGLPLVRLDLEQPADRDRIRMMALELSPREISDTYNIDMDVLRVILQSRREVQ